MGEHLGEIYEGVISSITSWGVYVELPNTIEGMIHVSMLPVIISIMMKKAMKWLVRQLTCGISWDRN